MGSIAYRLHRNARHKPSLAYRQAGATDQSDGLPTLGTLDEISAELARLGDVERFDSEGGAKAVGKGERAISLRLFETTVRGGHCKSANAISLMGCARPSVYDLHVRLCVLDLNLRVVAKSIDLEECLSSDVASIIH